MKSRIAAAAWFANLVLVAAVFAQAPQPSPTADPFADDAQPGAVGPGAVGPRAIAPGGTGPAAPPDGTLPPPAAPGDVEPENQPARRAYGFELREDGGLVGQVDYIDVSTLELHPVSNGIITFMQDRRVIAQVRSGPQGEFLAQGLTASAVYSVFVTHRDWYAAGSVVVYPPQPDKGSNSTAANGKESRNSASRRLATILVSTQPSIALAKFPLASAGNQAVVAPVMQLQLIPREDFISAIRQGVLGGDLGGAFPGGTGGTGGPGGGAGGSAGSGAGGGGSGGGGGGGAGGGGAGGAVGGIGAAGVAAGIASGTSRTASTTPSSTFRP